MSWSRVRTAVAERVEAGGDDVLPPRGGPVLGVRGQGQDGQRGDGQRGDGHQAQGGDDSRGSGDGAFSTSGMTAEETEEAERAAGAPEESSAGPRRKQG